jgi:Predicted integral membrane protein (DUF2269)
MSPQLALFLFLHVMGAIAVFGPTFVFPILAMQVRKSPQNGHFGAVLGEFIERRVVIPGAIVQGITGLALVWIIGANLTDSHFFWLDAGIILYLIAISFAITVQAKAAEKMVELTAGGPPPGPPLAGAPAGPPPAILANAAKLQQGGLFLTVLIVLIVVMMVVKPGYY